MKVIFMGSPLFAVPSFELLLSSGHEIVACFTQAAKAKNRGKKLLPTPIEQIAKKHNIPVYTPKTLKDDDVFELIKNLNADFIIVVAYGLILPANILALAKYSALNLHPSALPQFRGAAPIQRTIMSGANTTNICVIKMLAELDAGPIYKFSKINITGLNYGELHDMAANIGAKLIIEVIRDFNKLNAASQSNDFISYAPKISKAEAEIDFLQEGDKIINLIRALNPYPGAYFNYKEERFKILVAEFLQIKHNKKIGHIDESFSIFCKNGVIKPKIIQKSGKKPLTLVEFLNGYNIKKSK